MKSLNKPLILLFIISVLLVGCGKTGGKTPVLEGSHWAAYSDVTSQTVDFSKDGTLTIGNSLNKGESAKSLKLSQKEITEALTPRVFYYRDKERGKVFEMYKTREDMQKRKNGIDVNYKFTETGIEIAGGKYERAN
ncbi:MAG: hypothetical protein Q8873_00875 [Bacillota bacterium]|nr:hypothetical protein [Bacillota bacterium]